jgi:hypothetical protein
MILEQKEIKFAVERLAAVKRTRMAIALTSCGRGRILEAVGEREGSGNA